MTSIATSSTEQEQRDKETMMADQAQTQQSIPPLAVRLTDKDGWWGKIVLAAAKIAVARRNGKNAPADQGRLIAEGVYQIKATDRYPMFFGDMVALGLSGLIKHPDPAGRDAIRQVEEALNELKKRHGDKPPHAYPPKDAIAFYELMTRLDVGIDPIDNSPECTGIILDRKAKNRVRAFSFLRRAVGITRNGHYREGEKLKQNDDFTRINQDGMRALLQMYEEHMRSQGKPVVSAPAEVVISSEEDQFIGDLARTAAEQNARRSETDEEWAFKICSLWLAGKEPDDDEGPSEEGLKIGVLKEEIRRLTDAVAKMEADLKSTSNDIMRSAGQAELSRLRDELQKKMDELALLEKPATTGAKPNGTTPKPGEGAPMPGNAVRITVAAEDGTTMSVEEAITKLQKQIEEQMAAAASHAANVTQLYADAAALMTAEKMDDATEKMNQATQAKASGTAASEQVTTLQARLAELEELKTKGAQPTAEPGKDKQPKPKKVRLSGRKASATARAAAGGTTGISLTAPAAADNAYEEERQRTAELVGGSSTGGPVKPAPGAVTPSGDAERNKMLQDIARFQKEVLIGEIKAKTDVLGEAAVKNFFARISANEDLAAIKAEFEAMTS